VEIPREEKTERERERERERNPRGTFGRQFFPGFALKGLLSAVESGSHWETHRKPEQGKTRGPPISGTGELTQVLTCDHTDLF
jgi:hypothetical protein